MESQKREAQEIHFEYLSQYLKCFAGLIIFSVLFTLNHLSLSDYFPIKTVRVYGVNHVDHKKCMILIPSRESRLFYYQCRIISVIVYYKCLGYHDLSCADIGQIR